MDIFELLTKEAIHRNHATAYALAALAIVTIFFAWKTRSSVSSQGRDTLGMLVIAASTLISLILIMYFRSSSTFNQVYSEVATIKNSHTVEVKVDGQPVKIDLNHDREDPIRHLTDALSQTTGQHGFNKIKEVKQISESRYEVIYQRKCGKISSYVSVED